MTPRIAVLFNPTAGARKRRKLAIALARLTDGGAAVELIETQAVGDAEKIAASMTPARCDVLAVAGGDGTINEAVNGLMANSSDRLPALAVLPFGTANVLAHEIGVGGDLNRAIDAVLAGKSAEFPLGRMSSARGTRHFVMMAGVGFDAHVVRHLDKGLKKRIGKLAYGVASFGCFLGYRPTLYRLQIDGVPHQAASAILTRGRFYAGAFMCAPGAKLAEARLHACLFERAGRWQVLRYGLAMLANRLPRAHFYRTIAARAVTILGPASEPVQADGDLAAAALPLTVDIAERRLSLIVPG